MKQLSITILLIMFMSLVSTKAVAHDIEVMNSDGVTIYYNWIDNHKNLAVTFQGRSFQNAQSYSGNVVIPESVEYEGNTYNVTEIGNHAFENCQNLSSVIFPKGLTTIGEEAFYYCIKLKTIAIPQSVTSVRANAFWQCSGLTSVHIKDLSAWCKISFSKDYTNGNNQGSNPLSYAHHLFLNEKEITELIIPDDVTSIRDYAFQGCSSLNTVSIPNTVTSIGNEAFRDCSGLSSITIAESVTSIGKNAFLRCTTLTSIIIPNTVTRIGDEVFRGCSELESITIPNSVNYVGNDAFRDTKWYNNQPDGLVYAGLVAYKYKGTMPTNTDLVIKEETKSIVYGAFYNCSGMSSITIPNSVYYIGAKSFSGCSGLTSVHISDIAAWCNIFFELHDVGGFDYCFSNPLFYAEHLFINGEEITDLTIPEGVTSINDYTFKGCNGLTSVTIPNSVTKIGIRAFMDCTNLMTITIGSGVTSIGGGAFSNVNSGNLSRTRTENNILRVLCKAETVPETSISAFDKSPIEQGLLIVPNNAVAAYQTSSPWNGFGNISSETEYLDIEGIYMNSVNARIYDLRGNHLEKLHRGMNIIKMNNGSTKKVFVN